MPLTLPKEGATQEEINQWIIDTQESYNKLEKEHEEKVKREQELLESNQKLFLRITTKKEEKQDTKEEDEIPYCMDKDTYEKLSDKDKKELSELLESEEDE